MEKEEEEEDDFCAVPVQVLKLEVGTSHVIYNNKQ